MQDKNQLLHFGSIVDNTESYKVKTEPHYIDKLLGENIKRARIHNGMSQNQLAHELGITFQQVQKYEKGSNRIVVSRLFPLARALSVAVGELLKGVSYKGVSVDKTDLPYDHHQVSNNNAVREDGVAFIYEDDAKCSIDSKEILMLVRVYRSIHSEKVRASLYHLIKSLSLQQDDSLSSLDDFSDNISGEISEK